MSCIRCVTWPRAPALRRGNFGTTLTPVRRAGHTTGEQPMELPETEYPTEREARIAKRHNEMVNEMKFTPYWIDPPMRATTGTQQLTLCDPPMAKRGGGNAGDLTVYSSRCAEIERWSDQFKPKTASAATAVAALRTVHAARQYDKELLPPSAFEAVFEKKPRGKSTVKGRSSGLAVLFSLCAARRTSTRQPLRRAAIHVERLTY